MIVVDASFDPAMDKIDFMHNHSDFCNATWSQAAPLSPVPELASCQQLLGARLSLQVA